jgi:hypothetical protein
MDERRFDEELAAVSAGLRARRGDCPDTEEIVGFARGEVSDAAAARIRGHLRLCDSCRQLAEAALAEPAEVDEPTWSGVTGRLDRRQAPWRGGGRRRPGLAWLGTAAAVLAATGLSYYWPATGPPSGGPVSTTRGAALQPVEPIGEVRELEAFRWQAPPLDVSYRVEVRHGDTEVWSGSAPGSRLEPPPELRRALEPGVAYRWRALGLDEAGRIVVTSDWVELRVLPAGG